MYEFHISKVNSKYEILTDDVGFVFRDIKTQEFVSTDKLPEDERPDLMAEGRKHWLNDWCL